MSFVKNTITYLSLLIFTMLLPAPIFASEIKSDETYRNPSSMVCDGVYTRQGLASSGEVVYFGMELLTDINVQHWHHYMNSVNTMTDQPGYISNVLGANNCVSTGYTDQEFAVYKTMLVNKGFIRTPPFGALSNKLLALIQMGCGVTGFLREVLNDDDTSDSYNLGSSYVAYISKTPVTSNFPFPKKHNNVTIKSFNDDYEDLLMTIGVFFDPFQIRGIASNPKRFIDGGYRGLSTFLIESIALVNRQFMKPEKYLLVKPMTHMSTLLKRKFEPGQMYIGYNKKAVDGYLPLIHEFGGTIKLAKEGVDVCLYDEAELPDECTDYTFGPNSGIHTHAEYRHLIKTESILENELIQPK